MLPLFCFPFGINLKEIDCILMNKVFTETLNHNLKENFFVFTLRSQNTDNNEFGDEFLNKLNPNHFLYFICIKTYDIVQKVFI